MIIHPLSEGIFTIGYDKVFMPFDPETDVLEERSRGSLLVEVQPFLIARGNELILCDAGLGFTDSYGKPQIYSLLERLGYHAEDISHILMSHLHKDHAGGLLYKSADGRLKPSFPEAVHYIHKSEWDFAIATGAPSYHPEDFLALDGQAELCWLEGEAGNPTAGIYWEHSGGHSRQHIVFTIHDGTETAFFGGDEAPQLKQMKMRYTARYDYDGQRAMELRQQYAQRGKESGWEFLFYHDIKTPTSRLGF